MCDLLLRQLENQCICCRKALHLASTMNYFISPVHTVETKDEQGLTTSQTHYRSHWGWVFTVETNTALTTNCQLPTPNPHPQLVCNTHKNNITICHTVHKIRFIQNMSECTAGNSSTSTQCYQRLDMLDFIGNGINL